MRGSSAFTDHDWPEEEDTEGVDEGFCWQYYAGSEAKRREAMSGKIGWMYVGRSRPEDEPVLQR